MRQDAFFVRAQVATFGAAGRIIPGIGVTADESRLDPAQVARQAGCPGFVLFDLTGTLRDEPLPALRQGVTQPINLNIQSSSEQPRTRRARLQSVEHRRLNIGY